jgi:secreted trypsin-like serine protease
VAKSHMLPISCLFPYVSESSEWLASLKEKLPRFPVCGSESTDRIFGGQIVDVPELPWTVLIGYSKDQTNQKSFNCGGSLINNRYVLTGQKIHNEIFYKSIKISFI